MTKLENFEDLFVGEASEIEKNLSTLLPEAKIREDQSIYLQILSRIALAQAMQQKFDQAHHTLDQAEAGLTPHYDLARVRILMERGRVYHQSGNVEAALPLLKQSYELSEKYNFDLPFNVASFIANMVKNLDEKTQWCERAINVAKKSQQTRVQEGIGYFYKTLAQNYVDVKRYKDALETFKQYLKFIEGRMDVNQGDFITAREAKWGMAQTLRLLGNLDEALAMQFTLLKDYEDIIEKGDPPNDLPEEMLVELRFAGRGMVYEELAKIHMGLAKKYGGLSYGDFSKTGWSVLIEPERLEKMRALSLKCDSYN